jgi:TP901-1 family phage major tail protein
MTAHVGRDVLIEFAIADENASEASLTWLNLGMMRGKSIKTSWDTADTTADDSPDFTKTSLVTFKNVEFSGDGVSYDDAVYNQETLEAHVVSPGSATANQPKVWFKLTYPSGKFYSGPFIVSEWSNDSPYSETATWSISASSNGAVNLTPA